MLNIANAHNDFVKCLHVLPTPKILVSGGSDKDIRFWDLRSLDEQATTASSSSAEKVTNAVSGASLEATGSSKSPHHDAKTTYPPLSCLATPKSQHTRPIECFASCSVTVYDKANDEYTDTGRICLWSADSMGRICVWQTWRDNAGNHYVESRHTWLAHETAVYEIRMNSEGEAWTGPSSTSFHPQS